MLITVRHNEVFNCTGTKNNSTFIFKDYFDLTTKTIITISYKVISKGKKE